MRIIILSLLGLLLFSPFSSVQAKSILVQTEPYQVPVVTQKGRKVKGTITLYVTFAKKADVINFCNQLPKVREAVLFSFAQNPIRYINREYHLDGASDTVFKKFESVFPNNGISKVVVVSGIKKRAEGSSPIPISGVNSKCTPVTQKPKFVMEAEEKNIPEVVIKKQTSKFESPVQEGFVNPYQQQPEAKGVSEDEPEKDNNPEPLSKENDKNSEPVEDLAQLKPDSLPVNSKPSCTSRLSNFWNAGEHVVSGEKYWLKRVFTLDRNNDSITDDINFSLVRHDGGDYLNLYYIGETGQNTINLAPSLALSNQSVIAQFCQGDLKFKQPVQKVAPAKVQKIENPEPASSAPVSKKLPKDTDDGFGNLVIIVIVAALIAMALATILYVKLRKSAKQRRIDRRMSDRRVAEGLDPSGPKFSPEDGSGTNMPLSEKDKKRERRINAQNRRKGKGA